MQKIAIAGLSGLILCSLAACGNANQNASKYAAYPYEATIDDNSDILILAKNEEALNRFIDKSVSAEIDSTFSDCEQGTVLESGDALVIENAEFENCMGSEEYSKVHIKVRNKSGKSGTILNLRLLLLILIREIERYLRWRMNSMGEHSPFFIQRNKFTLSIRNVKSGSVSHFPFSILNFVLLCCSLL